MPFQVRTVEHSYSAVEVIVSCLKVKGSFIVTAVGQGDELRHDLVTVHDGYQILVCLRPLKPGWPYIRRSAQVIFRLQKLICSFGLLTTSNDTDHQCRLRIASRTTAQTELLMLSATINVSQLHKYSISEDSDEEEVHT